MKILIVGDVCAAPGRRVLNKTLPDLIRRENIDFCIVNGENAAHGVGITPKIADEFFRLGADVITLGNHTFGSYEFLSQVGKYDNIVVPSNVGGKWPGNEYCIVEKNGFKLGVINLLGQFAMNPIPDNPFNKAEELISRLKDEHVNGIVVDFHAEATAEKTAMGYLLDGRVSVVFGTHTHVQTADNRVLKGGTGYITDIGMSGCIDSVIGMEISRSLGRLKDKLPERYDPQEGEGVMCGVIASLDDEGRCLEIRRFNEYE